MRSAQQAGEEVLEVDHELLQVGNEVLEVEVVGLQVGLAY